MRVLLEAHYDHGVGIGEIVTGYAPEGEFEQRVDELRGYYAPCVLYGELDETRRQIGVVTVRADGAEVRIELRRE